MKISDKTGTPIENTKPSLKIIFSGLAEGIDDYEGPYSYKSIYTIDFDGNNLHEAKLYVDQCLDENGYQYSNLWSNLYLVKYVEIFFQDNILLARTAHNNTKKWIEPIFDQTDIDIAEQKIDSIISEAHEESRWDNFESAERLRSKSEELRCRIQIGKNILSYNIHETAVISNNSGLAENNHDKKQNPISTGHPQQKVKEITHEPPISSTGENSDTSEIKNNPSDLDGIYAARARNLKHAREAMGLNSIQTYKEEEKDDTKHPKYKRLDIAPIVPSEIESMYVQVGGRFYYRENTSVLAFEDKGSKLETQSNDTLIAQSMVRIAESRGWEVIKVVGSETFCRQVWLDASSRGIDISGYTPSEQDRAELAKHMSQMEANLLGKERLQSNTHDHGSAGIQPTSESSHHDRALAARIEKNGIDDAASVLIAHGPAKYLHDKNNADSYYVTTRDKAGTEKTSWGKDLARAIYDSGVKIGDPVFITREGFKEVTVQTIVRDTEGKEIGVEEKNTRRNAWNIKLAEMFANASPDEAVKTYPELSGAVATVAAIKKKAEADGLNSTQHAIVMARVRQNVANSIERGELPKVSIRQQAEVGYQATQELDSGR